MFVSSAGPNADSLWTPILCRLYSASTKVSIHCVPVCCQYCLQLGCCEMRVAMPLTVPNKISCSQHIHSRLVFNSSLNCLSAGPVTEPQGNIHLAY